MSKAGEVPDAERPQPETGTPATASAPSSDAVTVPMLNVANLLTIFRMVMVPVFLVALFAGSEPDGDYHLGWRLVATVLFAVASLTDQIDGWVARKYGLITDFGKIADPIADKALTGSALVGLSILGELPWWVTLTIAARELGVTLLRFWVIRYGVIPASRGGKWKTMTQIVAIVVYLLPLPDAVDPVRWVLMGLAVLLTVATGIDYVVRALRLRAVGQKVGK